MTICRYLKKEPAALYDIGVGDKTEWKNLKEQYPFLRVYGCEPNHTLYDKLIDIFPGSLAPLAVGSEAGPKTLYIPEGKPMSASLYKTEDTEREFRVAVITLDQFDLWAAEQQDIILWLDIEGSELSALKSGMRLLRSGRILAINLEVRDEAVVPGWATSKEIDDLLTSLDFKLVKTYLNNVSHRDVIYVPKG